MSRRRDHGALSPQTHWFLILAAGLVVVAFASSAGLCALIRHWASQLGFLDRPGGHKGHTAPIPLGGGVAIWLTTAALPLLGSLIAPWVSSWLGPELSDYAGGVIERRRELYLILGCSTLIMLMGLADDRKALGWRLRLGIQVALASLLAVCDIRITLFRVGPFAYPAFESLVTVLWIVGLTNAFNFLDNMDGLAASVGLIAASLFIGAQLQVGSLFVPAMLLSLIGALAGFLVHNRYPARMFMGDAGSNFLGFFLGAMTVAGKYYQYDVEGSRWNVLSPLLVMAVPLYDTTSVVLIRLSEGRSPFEGDRRHFSHRLVQRGLTPKQAVRTIDLVTLAGGLGALLLHRLDGVGAWVVVAQTVCLLGVVAHLEVAATRPERDDVEAKPANTGPSGIGTEPEPAGKEAVTRERTSPGS